MREFFKDNPMAWFTAGCAFIGFGLAVFGMASCQANEMEQMRHNRKDMMDFAKWKMEHGFTSKEEAADADKSVFERLFPPDSQPAK